MKSSEAARSYRDLRAWQEGMQLAENCYQITKNFPKEERYGLISQIRRAAVSIPANIAERYGRGSRGEYVQFLYIAQGSLNELITHLLLSTRLEMPQSESIAAVLSQSEIVSKILHALLSSLRKA